MTDRQRDSTAKFFYDMAKGVGLIAVVGGLAGGRANLRGVSSFFLAVVSVILATVTYFYTHPRKKQ